MGIAEVHPQAIFDSSAIEDVNVDGKINNTPIKAKTRIVQIGPVRCEFIQPVEGQSIYRESLERRGEGIIDLTFTVEDLDKETDRLVEKGVWLYSANLERARPSPTSTPAKMAAIPL